MALAVFLPPVSIPRVRELLRDHELRIAHSWRDLDRLVSDKDVEATVFDPSANGLSNIREPLEILSKHSSICALAYVQPTPANLRAVLMLSRGGLEHVFVHPLPGNGQQLVKAVERFRMNVISLGILGIMNAKVARLPCPLTEAVLDLFERPHRYLTAADIGRQAGITTKQTYKRFSEANLGTPKKLVIAAKVVRAYAYLRLSRRSVVSVSQMLGYSNPRIFAAHVFDVFRCSPDEIRNINPEELLLELIEWNSKPAAFGRAFGGRRAFLRTGSNMRRANVPSLVDNAEISDPARIPSCGIAESVS